MALAAVAAVVAGCRPASGPEVVVYASQDKVYADPLLQQFTRESGIRVLALFDSEAVKTVGLANRLKSEAGRPVCDLFWNNEPFRTRLLQKEGVLLDGTNAISFGVRQRVLALNRWRIGTTERPQGIEALTNVVWRGRVAMAYPLFGTTATHLLALRQRWGEARWAAWCRAMVENGVKLVDGNSVAARLAQSGDVAVALTDSDDVEALRREGGSLEASPLGADGLSLPNTAALVRGAPHPDAARTLLRYLSDPKVLESLQNTGAVDRADAIDDRRTPDWDRLIAEITPALESLKQWFLR